MAGAKDVLLRFLVDDKQKSKLKGIGDEAQKTGGRFTQMSGGMKAAAVGAAALIGTKIIGFLGDAAVAAGEDQKAQELLALAIQNSTTATDADIETMEGWIKKTSLATGVADDELRPALGDLVRATGDLEEAQDLLGAAMDISAAKGIPVETIARAIGKAAGGSVGSLGKLGIATKDADGKMLSFNEIMEKASQTMGGSAATAADTMAGRMAIFKVTVDEAKESIGNALIPSLADAAEVGGDLATIFGGISDKLNDIGGVEAKGESVWSTIMHFSGFQPVLDGLGWVADKLGEVEVAASKTENPFQGLIDNMVEVAGSTDTATVALEDFEDEVRSQIDPIFNLISKVNDLDTAQLNSSIARDKYGEGSPQHREALRKEAESWLSVKDAQIKAANEAGLTRDAFQKVLEDMQIFTHEDIELILKDFDRVNDYEFRDKTIRTRVVRGDDTRSIARAAGGPVRAGSSYLVGEAGPEVVTMGSQGSVTPNHRLRNGGGSEIIILQVDGREIARAVRNHDRSLLPG